MIVYLDTSAVVPLVVNEPGSSAMADLWDAADHLVTTRLTYVETVAALAMAQRIARISAAEYQQACEQLQELWPQLDIVELDEHLMLAAARAADEHDLRGYDSVHCAAALAMHDEQLVAATGDQKLLAAWHTAGIHVFNTNAGSE